MEQATQVLGYKGNPDQGYGAAGTPLIEDDQSLARTTQNIQNNISQLSQQSQQWNMMMYGQKIKDRDDTMAMFKDTNMDYPMTDEDRKVVQGKLSDFTDYVLSNADAVGSDIKTHLQAQQIKNQFLALGASAKAREAEFGKMRVAIAAELDPAQRDDMQRHLAAQQKTDINTPIKPYFQQVDPWKVILNYDPKEKALEPGVNAMGLPVAKSQHDLDDFVSHYSMENVMQQPYLMQNIRLGYNQAVQHPELTKPESIAATNLKVGAINKAYGHTDPNDAKYLPPIATKDANGNFQITDDPYKYALSMAAASKIDPTVKTTYNKDLQEGLFKQAEVKDKAADSLLKAAQAQTQKSVQAENNAHAGLYNAQAAKERVEATLTGQQIINLQNANPQVSAAVVQADQTYENILQTADKNANFKKATPQDLASTLLGLNIPITPATAGSLYKNMGITKDWNITPVDRDEAAMQMLSQPGGIDLLTKKQTNPIRPAGAIFATNPATGEQKLIGLTSTGGIQKVLPRREAAHALLDNQLGYDNNAATIKQHDQIQSILGGTRNGVTTNSASGRAPDKTTLVPIVIPGKNGKADVTVYKGADGGIWREDESGNLRQVKK